MSYALYYSCNFSVSQYNFDQTLGEYEFNLKSHTSGWYFEIMKNKTI